MIDAEEEEYFKSYKNMFESQLEAPPEIDEDELLQDEEEMLKDILQEEENDYLEAMYSNDMAQQNQSLPVPPPISKPLEPQKLNENNHGGSNEDHSLASEISMKQKGKRPALDFEDEDDMDFSILNSNNKSKKIDPSVGNPLNALNSYIPSSSLHHENTLEWEHKNKKSEVWESGLGFGFSEDSEPLEWQQPSSSSGVISSRNKSMEDSVLEWKGFTDVNENEHAQVEPHLLAYTTLNPMNVESVMGDFSLNERRTKPTSTSPNYKNFTERPEAGTVYLTGYSFDNIPLYIPFKPIPTVNEIHRRNKEWTAKNMNGQLLDVSIYQLMEEIEKEDKEKKEIQEAKDVIQQYNTNVENQEEYMEIWEDDHSKSKGKGKGKESEDHKEKGEYKKNLWVNAYTPKRYTDLLGDEVKN